MQTPIYNIEHQQVGTCELPEAVFGQTVKPGLHNSAVLAQRASQRSGCHSTRTRANVRGGGAKPFKQKGTGRARQGSSRSPIHVGGGVVFGPHPRSYATRLPRSMRRSALCSALSCRVADGALMILQDFKLDAPKTRVVADFLARGDGWSALLVDGPNEMLKRSARNLARAKYLNAEAINVMDILRFERLVMTQAALQLVIDKAMGQSGEAGDEHAA